ncbi:aldehyde dehydrogenase family protein [Methylomarinum vadi]|uniref:aldehyde dehydrogenase family protein n=1 Tax=Methylomarinum vadi TaxID=438855 RepID=UPI0004DF9314|nr:aldehyde dehydrogenase family protein [Methylomarinum vadi]
MSGRVFEATSPVDGRLLKTYRETAIDQIGQRIATARQAAEIWAGYSIERRLAALSPLRDRLATDIDSISDRLAGVTGKVRTEILLGEIYPLLHMLDYYGKHAAAILAPQAVSTSALMFPDATAGYEYKPYGVVAVISPWNFPLQLTLYPLLSALIAGNGVVFKTSELSLPIGELIVELFAALEIPQGLVQWIIGGPEAGRQLIEQRPDLVFFTGGLNAGRSVMNQAARHPIPLILELGGKDAMVVFADAYQERAVNAALYGAFSNSGQVCVAVERLYVEDSLYLPFVERLCEAVVKLTLGQDGEGDAGPIISQQQLAVIEAHYHDALAKGARASGPLQRNGNYLRPVILWNVNEDMRVVKEETFGPLLPVMVFATEQEAITRINRCEFGLNASVWSRDLDKAQRVAEQLSVGNWAVNDLLKNIGHAGLPFGGIKNSGFGRYHGAEGLRSFTYTVSGMVNRGRLKREPNWFPYTEQGYKELRSYVDFVFGSGTWLQRMQRNWPALLAMRQYAGFYLRQYWRNFLCLISRRHY